MWLSLVICDWLSLVIIKNLHIFSPFPLEMQCFATVNTAIFTGQLKFTAISSASTHCLLWLHYTATLSRQKRSRKDYFSENNKPTYMCVCSDFLFAYLFFDRSSFAGRPQWMKEQSRDWTKPNYSLHLIFRRYIFSSWLRKPSRQRWFQAMMNHEKMHIRRFCCLNTKPISPFWWALPFFPSLDPDWLVLADSHPRSCSGNQLYKRWRSTFGLCTRPSELRLGQSAQSKIEIPARDKQKQRQQQQQSALWRMHQVQELVVVIFSSSCCCCCCCC